MKKIILLVSITALLVLYSCNVFQRDNAPYQLEVLYDVTEVPPLPYPKVSELLNEYRTEYLYHPFEVTLDVIADISFGTQSHYTLPKANKLWDNEYNRKDSLAVIEKTLSENFKSLQENMGASHSIVFDKIYSTIVKLNESPDAIKRLVVISNLFQNDDFNGYRRREMILNRPDEVAKILMKDKPSISGKGIKVYIYYKPKDFEDNKVFTSYVKIYKAIFREAEFFVQAP